MCGVTLTEENHYESSTNLLCKKCYGERAKSPEQRRKQKEWRERNRDRRREILRSYNRSERGREVHRRYMKSAKGRTLIARWNRSKKAQEALRRYQDKYRRENPGPVLARRLLKLAEFLGYIHRPTTCQVCGEATRRLEAHHADYTRPLDVEWLCRRCHLNEGHDGCFRNLPRAVVDQSPKQQQRAVTRKSPVRAKRV